ncbi:PTS sugar transporter subunit IIA [Agaribacterium sp. ZY112]|uniref:PTS sugar transporter subunit IIA n=1 Tax=Agaribacterium sp. ZY112 TaxID=3233574 RepID=UPI0035251C41
MWIKNVLSETLCAARIEGVSKKRVLDKVAQTLGEQYGVDANTLFSQLVAREKLGSTGIGDGVAIPHCRFDTDEAMLAVFTLDQGIDFDAIDQQPVDVVFAMVAPENSEQNHLENLAAIASALQNEDYLKHLRQANSAQELYLAATEQ